MSLIQRKGSNKVDILQNISFARFDESKNQEYLGFANYYDNNIKPIVTEIAKKKLIKEKKLRILDFTVAISLTLILVMMGGTKDGNVKEFIFFFATFFFIFFFTYLAIKSEFLKEHKKYDNHPTRLKTKHKKIADLIRKVYEFDSGITYRAIADDSNKELLKYKKFGLIGNAFELLSLRMISVNNFSLHYEVEYFDIDGIAVDVIKVKLPTELGISGVIVGTDRENYLFNFEKNFLKKNSLNKTEIAEENSYHAQAYFSQDPKDKIDLNQLIKVLRKLVSDNNAAGFKASFLGDELLITIYHSDAFYEEWNDGFFTEEEQEAFSEKCEKAGVKAKVETEIANDKSVTLLPLEFPYDYIKESELILSNLASIKAAISEIAQSFEKKSL